MSSAKRKEASVAYREMRTNLVSMGDTILKLMRHPDATPEHLADAHRAYSAVYTSYVDATRKLRETYGQGPFLIQDPWWDKLI